MSLPETEFGMGRGLMGGTSFHHKLQRDFVWKEGGGKKSVSASKHTCKGESKPTERRAAETTAQM